MAVTFSNAGTLLATVGGANRSGNVTIPANTKAFYAFIYPDTSNTTGLTSAPSVITLNGVTMTLVAAVPSQASAPYGNCQHVYKVDNPAAGTFSLSVTHAQYFFVAYVSVVTTNPLITTVGAFNYTTSTSPSCTVSSSNGNNTLFSVVADATDSAAGFTDNSGTLTAIVNDGGTGRCGYRIARRTSSGSPHSNTWTIPVSKQWSAIAINFSDDIYVVDTVTDPVDPSGTLTYTTSGFASVTGITTDLTGVTVGSISDTAGDGTAVVSGFTEGGLYPILPTAVSYTFTDGSNNSAKNGNISVPSGYTKLVIGTPLFSANTIPSAIFSATGRVISTSDIFLHTSYGDLIITDDGDWTATSGGSFDLWLRVAAGADAGKMFQYTVNITEDGAVIEDTTPDDFTFTDVTGAAASTVYESNVITVTGVTSGVNIATAISGSGGTNHQYAVSTDGGTTYGDYTSSPTNVQLNYKIKVRLTSNATTSHGGGETASATLTVGGVSDTFTVTNAGVNTNPVVNSVLITELSGQIDASDGEGDTLTYTLTTDGIYGSAVVNSSSGAFTYTPDVSFTGNDSFVVTITDGYGGTTVVTVSIVDTLSGGYSIRLGVGYGIGIGF